MDLNLITIFTTGLFVGGLTCLAVQGGLLAATLSQQEEFKIQSVRQAQDANSKFKIKNGNALPILSFLIAKLIAYTILGFLLGRLGSLISLSIQAQVILQLAVVIFMVGTALNLLNVHPIFRYFAIQPPRFLTKLVRKKSKSKSIFAPALLGAFTVFIPCGTTQAMMALAIASGNPLIGALIMFVFILGTSPLFFVLGFLTMKLGDVLHRHFVKVAAAALLLLALFNLDATIALSGSQNTLKNIFTKAICLVSYCDSASLGQLIPVEAQVITITDNGYEPNYFAVKAGTDVTLKFENKGSYGCAQAFTIPSLNIQKVVPPNESSELTFKAPSKPGKLVFTCSMGMYPGVIDVM